MTRKLTTRTGFSGFTLVEILIVIAIFSIISIVATQSIATSLRTSNKSESTIYVKENVNYALNTMERLLRNSRGINYPDPANPLSYCNGTPRTSIRYFDERRNPVTFSCIISVGTGNYIASHSGTRITGTDIEVTNCNVFSCTYDPQRPESITISITARRRGTFSTSIEGAQITARSQINLRNYR